MNADEADAEAGLQALEDYLYEPPDPPPSPARPWTFRPFQGMKPPPEPEATP